MQHQLQLCPKKLLPPTPSYLPDISQGSCAFKVVPGVRAIA